MFALPTCSTMPIEAIASKRSPRSSRQSMTRIRPVAEALLVGAAAGQLGLALGEGDAEDRRAVLARDVARERPPATADVEDALTGLELELVGRDASLTCCASSSVEPAGAREKNAHEYVMDASRNSAKKAFETS